MEYFGRRSTTTTDEYPSEPAELDVDLHSSRQYCSSMLIIIRACPELDRNPLRVHNREISAALALASTSGQTRPTTVCIGIACMSATSSTYCT